MRWRCRIRIGWNVAISGALAAGPVAVVERFLPGRVRWPAGFALKLATVPCGGGAGREDRLLLDFKVGDFGFDLRLELVRGAPEFGEKFSGLPSHLRQLLRPKENERQEEQEDGVGKTHGPS